MSLYCPITHKDPPSPQTEPNGTASVFGLNRTFSGLNLKTKRTTTPFLVS